MEREIAFRGKSKYTGEWVEGYYVGDNTIIAYNEVIYDLGFIDTSPCHDCYPGSIGQFTGLYDKNGKEIYEGDILKHSYWDRAPLDVYQQGGKDEYIEEILVVKYSVESGRYRTDSFTDIDIWVCEDSEVIGNIHDNPELLKYGRD